MLPKFAVNQSVKFQFRKGYAAVLRYYYLCVNLNIKEEKQHKQTYKNTCISAYHHNSCIWLSTKELFNGHLECVRMEHPSMSVKPGMIYAGLGL